jgi:hypothetical protein
MRGGGVVMKTRFQGFKALQQCPDERLDTGWGLRPIGRGNRRPRRHGFLDIKLTHYVGSSYHLTQ